MKNIFKTSFHFVFLIIPLLILGACAKDITGAGESTGGGSTTGGDGDFIPEDPFADMGDTPPATSLVGTWNMTATVTESGCSEFESGNDYDFNLVIDSDGSCINDLSSLISSIDCQASQSQVISHTMFYGESSKTYTTDSGTTGMCYLKIEELDSATLNSSGNLTGTTKIEVLFNNEQCGTPCQVTAILEGTLDEESTGGGSSGSETSGETSGGSGTSGTSDGGSGSGGESSGTESGGSTTGDGTEESTISVESSQIVKNTFNATVEITNNTDSETLLVDVILQKRSLITGGGPGGSGPLSGAGVATLVAKTVTIAVGTTETKTLSFKIPENLSGTYIAILRLKYVDEDGTTQIVDTSEIIRNLEIE